MKKIYVYSLFFICVLSLVGILFFIWKKCELISSIENDENFIEKIKNDIEDFGDNNSAQKSNVDNKVVLKSKNDSIDSSQEVSKNDIVITKETLCIFEDVDKKDGSMTLTEKKLPDKFIGMNRDELEKVISNSVEFTGINHEYGAIHLELFSSDKIKVLRIYDSSANNEFGSLNKNNGYYLMEKDGIVCIYLQDQKTIYYESDILFDSLSYDLKSEIKHGKYIENESDLYDFLESYTS